jgi:hypothetical protein
VLQQVGGFVAVWIRTERISASIEVWDLLSVAKHRVRVQMKQQQMEVDIVSFGNHSESHLVNKDVVGYLGDPA